MEKLEVERERKIKTLYLAASNSLYVTQFMCYIILFLFGIAATIDSMNSHLGFPGFGYHSCYRTFSVSNSSRIHCGVKEGEPVVITTQENFNELLGLVHVSDDAIIDVGAPGSFIEQLNARRQDMIIQITILCVLGLFLAMPFVFESVASLFRKTIMETGVERYAISFSFESSKRFKFTSEILGTSLFLIILVQIMSKSLNIPQKDFDKFSHCVAEKVTDTYYLATCEYNGNKEVVYFDKQGKDGYDYKLKDYLEGECRDLCWLLMRTEILDDTINKYKKPQVSSENIHITSFIPDSARAGYDQIPTLNFASLFLLSFIFIISVYVLLFERHRKFVGIFEPILKGELKV